MSAIISLKHVEHWYDRGKQNEVHALKDINLDIEQGDYVAFFGPSDMKHLPRQKAHGTPRAIVNRVNDLAERR